VVEEAVVALAAVADLLVAILVASAEAILVAVELAVIGKPIRFYAYHYLK
jgi:hypothetical protein